MEYTRICVICGKQFITTHPLRKRCYDQHLKVCPICGKTFEICDIESPHSTCNSRVCKTTYMRMPKKEKLCKKCGNPFLPKAAHDLYCEDCRIRTCVICGKQFYHNLMDGTKTCGNPECVQKFRIQTNLDRYGVSNVMYSPEIKERTRNNNIKKYGVGNPLQNPEIYAQYKQKCIDTYGEVPLNSKESYAKGEQTRLLRYGSKSVLSCPDIKEKSKLTMLEKYGAATTFQSPELYEKSKQTMQEKYGVPYYCMSKEYQNNAQGAYKMISKVNLAFGNQLSSMGIAHQFEKTLDSYSYDVEILYSNILIELDPTITHNSYRSLFSKDVPGKPLDYHKNKSMCAENNGYRCIHIFDWDDTDKIISLLTPKTKIYARNCNLQKITNRQLVNDFLNQYHLQGTTRSQKYCYGLFHNDQLVQLMTFGLPRYNKQYEYELLRLCSHPQYRIVGGANRLFTAFCKEINPNSIISYCDLSKFTGDVYDKLGMKLLHITPPAKIWSKGKDKITDNLLRQRGYDQLFKTNFGKGTSNEQLMLDSKWLPVYDCGQAVYVYLTES